MVGCTSKNDYNGEYTTELCPYFGYTQLNPSFKIYEEGNKQFIELNGKTYVGEMDGDKLNFFESPENVPYSLIKKDGEKYELLPIKCEYRKVR